MWACGGLGVGLVGRLLLCCSSACPSVSLTRVHNHRTAADGTTMECLVGPRNAVVGDGTNFEWRDSADLLRAASGAIDEYDMALRKDEADPNPEDPNMLSSLTTRLPRTHLDFKDQPTPMAHHVVTRERNALQLENAVPGSASSQDPDKKGMNKNDRPT